MKLLLLCACLAVANADLAPVIMSKQRVVPDRWVVSVKDFSFVDTICDEIQSRFSKQRMPAPRMEKLRHLMPMLTMKIPSSIINDIRSIDGIEYLAQDVIVTPAGSQQNPPWGLDRIDSRNGRDNVYDYRDNYQGSGVNVYMVDTGINTNHDCFGGRAHILYGGSDDQGHGTHCAGVAVGNTYGIARKAQIYSVQVCKINVGCTVAEILKGVDAIMKHGAGIGGVVSMSISGALGNYQPFNDMAKNLWDAGFILSHGANNNNDDACNYSPQMNTDYLIVVGSVDNTNRRASTSSYGQCVEIFAPGVIILSAAHDSNQGTAFMSGTSMACPHVTGVAAVHFERNPTPSDVKSAIINDATMNVVSDAKGSPNRLLYLSPN